MQENIARLQEAEEQKAPSEEGEELSISDEELEAAARELAGQEVAQEEIKQPSEETEL